MEDVERARLQLGAKKLEDRAGRVVGLDRERPLGLRQWMQPKADAGDQGEPPLRAADEAGQVVAGDVLHHLPAGARDRPVRQHESDAEDEVAWRAEAMAKRAG